MVPKPATALLCRLSFPARRARFEADAPRPCGSLEALVVMAPRMIYDMSVLLARFFFLVGIMRDGWQLRRWCVIEWLCRFVYAFNNNTIMVDRCVAFNLLGLAFD